MEKLYTVNEVCELFRVTRDTVYRWMNSGQLAYIQVGGRRRVRESTILALFQRVNVEKDRPKVDPSWAT